MDMGVLAHKLIKYLHFGEFIMYQISYFQIMIIHIGKFITNTHHFWPTGWAVHSTHGGTVYKGNYSNPYSMGRGGGLST